MFNRGLYDLNSCAYMITFCYNASAIIKFCVLTYLLRLQIWRSITNGRSEAQCNTEGLTLWTLNASLLA